MKKLYIKPATEEINVTVEHYLLAGSGNEEVGGSDKSFKGTAKRNDFDFWDDEETNF